MPFPVEIKGRYEIRQVLGQGGMGVVYEAYDKVIKRGVALKTIRDIPSRAALDLFYKECDVLASISHPNIVEIFDLGEFEEDGNPKPYFVMPMLPGKTLDKLIVSHSSRLTVERTVEIISQACRGLQAAHERGLVHRDLKPSNIFVMDDDSVKIIDFGVAHMADTHSTMGHKGTLLYMAPEQVEMKPTSALSDIFSLGVVAFETLTLRHPFERASTSEVVTAILKQIPPPASELNPSVNGMISRVTHKAMAKQPWYRFASAREFGEALQKAARKEPIEMFDPARIQPRIQRAGKAFEQADYQFTEEILAELEAEGHVDPDITALRRRLDQAQRQKLTAQLLESARTRAEEQEYPLALQKLQELLEIQPANGAALSLKSSIESRRSEQKMEDWFRLARQHMKQNAFSHARQALQNVLELNPRDSRALELITEVDRREQDFTRTRREKEELYANALGAWQSGDVSAALSKLERLVDIDRVSPDTAAPERSATFQGFYNQVRSEHDTMKSSYEQARKHLVDGNFDNALAVCKDQLERHPGQALFQALQFDVEEGRRQQLSMRIAEVDRQVESEPDLEKRVSILSEALEGFPGEPHFERALRTMRDKRDLVRSIVSRAQALEEQGQFSDALAQWEILRTIYRQYPGLDFEIERVGRRRDQQVRADAKAKWVEQVDWQLEAGDYTRAAEILGSAAAEFPEDEELSELRKLSTQGLARTGEARKLLAEGQELCSRQRFDEGLEAFERAHELDAKSTVIRAALTGTLVEQARLKVERDWQTAERMADRALALDPANTQAKGVKTLALDRKRQRFVDDCVAQARRYQTDGQLEAALQQVDRGLSEFPRETRLAQLRTTLLKAGAETRETSVIAASASAAPKPAVPAPVASATETVLFAPPATGAAPPPVTPAQEASTIVMPPPKLEPPPVPTAPTVPAAPNGSAPAAPPAAPARRIPISLIAAAAAAFLLVASAILIVPRLKRAPVQAPAAKAVAPSAPVAAPVAPPANATLRVFTDLESGKYSLDDQPEAELLDGQLSLDNVPPGQHTLKINGAREQAAIAFATEPGTAPNISSLSAKEVLAVAVTSQGGHARVRSSGGSAKAALDGKPAGDIGPDGLELTDASQGSHELAIGEGKDLRSMVLEIGPAPMLTAYLKSDRNVGALVVATGEDGVHVFLNGKEYRRQTARGRLRIPNLVARDYSIRVVKDGFLETPVQQASVRKGEESKIEFQLHPIPKVASLSIQGAVPGAEVFLDQSAIGTVQDDGSFTASSVAPGDHTVELRKGSYKARRIERHFDEGAAVQFAAGDVAMEKLPGTLKWLVTPADAQVTIGRAGEASKPATGSALALPEGTYTLTAHAANYAERSATVSIASGESKTVELTLPKAAAKSLGMADWDDAAGWASEGSWYVRKGGEFVGFKPAQIAGTFVFTVELRKGKRLQWVAARTDAKNYVLFQMDKKFFYRSQVVNGKESQVKKIPHQAEKMTAYTIEVDVANGSIVHKLHQESTWAVLDNWEQGGGNFAGGKFGFLIPGGDVVALSNFNFAPK